MTVVDGEFCLEMGTVRTPEPRIGRHA